MYSTPHICIRGWYWYHCPVNVNHPSELFDRLFLQHLVMFHFEERSPRALPCFLQPRLIECTSGWIRPGLRLKGLKAFDRKVLTDLPTHPQTLSSWWFDLANVSELNTSSVQSATFTSESNKALTLNWCCVWFAFWCRGVSVWLQRTFYLLIQSWAFIILHILWCIWRKTCGPP